MLNSYLHVPQALLDNKVTTTIPDIYGDLLDDPLIINNVFDEDDSNDDLEYFFHKNIDYNVNQPDLDNSDDTEFLEF